MNTYVLWQVLSSLVEHKTDLWLSRISFFCQCCRCTCIYRIAKMSCQYQVHLLSLCNVFTYKHNVIWGLVIWKNNMRPCHLVYFLFYFIFPISKLYQSKHCGQLLCNVIGICLQTESFKDSDLANIYSTFITCMLLFQMTRPHVVVPDDKASCCFSRWQGLR
jgi:hypothetical protein